MPECRRWVEEIQSKMLDDRAAVSTVNTTTTTMQSWTKFLRDNGVLRSALKVKNIKRPIFEPNVIGPNWEFVGALYRLLEERPPSVVKFRDLALFHLLAFYGLRISSVLTLRNKDVNLMEGYLAPKLKGQVGRNHFLLADPTVVTLRHYMQNAHPYAGMGNAAFLTPQGYGVSRMRNPNKFLSRAAADLIVKRWSREMKLATGLDYRLSCHKLRHTAGTRAIELCGMESAADLLGHSDTRVTMRYKDNRQMTAKRTAAELYKDMDTLLTDHQTLGNVATSLTGAREAANIAFNPKGALPS